MIYPLEFGIKTLGDAAFDIITEAHICNMVREEFGKRILFGTAIATSEMKEDLTVLVCNENQFRGYLKDITNAVEIGTKFGISSLLLAHYAYHLTTIDIIPRTEPVRIWNCFGVSHKITYGVVKDDDEKKQYLKSLDFDFAFVDGDHSYKGVKFDFECVKKCGKVLFHDYDHNKPVKEGVVRFIDELPDKKVIKEPPFAYWRRDG
ncbi:hypothetical protein LCGC14_0643790 [marine sediment metagenome]|uniref:Class I SAM-dependent methyltransferase n=1 Tax=marine sediment metagenome TaxID=412755 RepID=A0A0F9U6S4_9ZZZZ|nr:class I SAM-dependent methyltransferase [Pricia sp.]